jgi:hypothetical protein
MEPHPPSRDRITDRRALAELLFSLGDLSTHSSRSSTLRPVCDHISSLSGLRVCLPRKSLPPLRASATGKPRLSPPGMACFVISARTGYADRATTGNRRHEDFHPARFVALSAVPPSRSIATRRYRDGRKLDRCSPALGGPGFWRRDFVGQFNHHELGGKLFGSVEVEVDGGAFGVRLGHHAEAVLDVLDTLALRECSHMGLLDSGRRLELRATCPYFFRPCERWVRGLGSFGDNGPGYAAAAMAWRSP